jgi:hypothetical protein
MPKAKASPESERRITVGGLLQEFWDLFPKEENPETKKKWNFHLCVFVDSHGIGPMHQRYEFCRDHGMSLIWNVYSGAPLPDGDLMFAFPCRWIPLKFAILFNHALNDHPSMRKGPRRRVMVVTMQPYFVGDCTKDQCLIIRNPAFDEKQRVTKERREGEVFGLESALSMLGG